MTFPIDWQKVPMQELYTGFWDGPHATPKEAASGPIYLGIRNITEDGHLDFSEIRHIAEEDYPTWIKRVEPKSGDIVFTYEATLHRYAIIPDGFRGCLGRRLALIRTNPQVVNTRFLFYYFFGDEWRKTVSKYMILGSTVDRIPIIDFPNFEVYLPPLSTQNKIAAILSAYDDLIENNTRRIKILEEMAQAIYREWFVHFRFPGHEGVKMVETELGLAPEGWKVVSFTDAVDVLSGGTPRTSIPEYWDGDIRWFTPQDINDFPFVIKTVRTITDLGLSKCNSRLYPANSIFVTARGTVGKCVLAAVPMAMSQTSYALLGKEDLSQYFVYLLMQNLVDVFRKKATGAVFDTIIVDTFRQQLIILPTRTVVHLFDRCVIPLFQNIKNLQLRNNNLRQTRDLLLPKLVSGELDVTELDIQVEQY